MFCVKCNSGLEKGSIFCSECGTPVSVVCGSCGGNIKADSKFCMHCGEIVDKSEEYKRESRKINMDKDRKKLEKEFEEFINNVGEDIAEVAEVVRKEMRDVLKKIMED